MNRQREAARLRHARHEVARPAAEKLAAAAGAAMPDDVTLVQLGELALHARKTGARYLRIDDRDGERLYFVSIDRLRAAAGGCLGWRHCRAPWRRQVSVTVTRRWLLLRWGEVGRLRLATWLTTKDEAAAALPVRSCKDLD